MLKNVAFIQIQKVATLNSDRKKINLITNKSYTPFHFSRTLPLILVYNNLLYRKLSKCVRNSRNPAIFLDNGEICIPILKMHEEIVLNKLKSKNRKNVDTISLLE